MVFSLAHFGLPARVLAAQSDPNFCAPSLAGGYYNTISGMSYDYGPDGLVRFYFDFSSDWNGGADGIIFYDGNCNSLGGTTSSAVSVPGIRHIMVRAVPTTGDPNVIYFDIEDRDTGVSYGAIFSTFTGTITVNSIVTVFFSWGSWVQSAGVHVKNIVAPKTPVLIVPGVLGTDIYKGSDLLWANLKMMDGFDGFMDPLGFNSDLTPIDNSLSSGGVIRAKTILGQGIHYIDGLINNLVAQGYTEGVDLFTFPYDWRFGVSDNNVDALQGQINYILNLTGAEKVDVVAHSTGGLLVKKYIMEHPADHHIGKAVFVGVPNLGAPLALKVLTVGDSLGVPGFDPREFKQIGHNMPVVYDLSPSQGYYSKIGSFFHLSTPWAPDFNDQERDMDFTGALNNLIDSGSLNSLGVDENKNLHTPDFDNFDVRTAGVDAYNIVGCGSATLGKFTGTVNGNGSWDFNFPQVMAGDGTVPFGSAQSIAADTNKIFFVPKIQHTNLLSSDGPSQEIVNILAESNLDTQGRLISYGAVAQNPALCSLKGEYLNIFSPVEISAADSSGNQSLVAADGSVENNIPGADYEIWGNHKFMFLPTDSGQQYTINLKGVGSGPATIKDVSLNNNGITGSQVFANVPVTPKFSGQIILPGGPAVGTTISINSSSGGAPQILFPSAIINADESQDNVAPIASSTLAGILNRPGIYKDYATVVLSANDPVVPGQESHASGLLGIEYSLDGALYQTYSGPVTVSSNGSHTMTFFAIDRAGNQSQPQTINFAVNNKTSQNGSCCGPCCGK